MSRILITDPFPVRPSGVPPDVLVITPHHSVAASLGVPSKSLRTWAKKILRQNSIGIASPMTASMALKASVQEIVGGRETAATARNMREMLGAILRSGIDVEHLGEIGSGRVRPLARVAREYVRRLKNVGLVDSEAVLVEARRLSNADQQMVLIYGYFRARQLGARPEEIEFIDRFAGDGSIYYLPCGNERIFRVNHEWRDRLVASGWEIRNAEVVVNNELKHGQDLAAAFAGFTLNREKDLPDASMQPPPALAYASIEAEVRGTLSRAKRAVLGGTSPDKIAIVCRDPAAYVHVIASVSREFGLAVEMEHLVPLRDTSFGAFISLLLDVKVSSGAEDVDRTNTIAEAAKASGSLANPFLPFDDDVHDDRGDFIFETTARLLRHPFGPGIPEDKWAEARRRRCKGFAAWVEQCPQIECMRSAQKLTTRAWVEWLKAVCFGWQVRGKDKAGKNAAELLAFNTFFESLDEFARHEKANAQSFDHFAAAVYEILADASTPFQPTAGGIAMHQPNTIVGGEFEQIFVIGMAEGVLPAPVIENSVIDFYERKQLLEKGIEFENPQEIPRWEALSFYFTLLAAKGGITFSYPRFADGQEQLPSPFFDRTGLKPTEEREVFVSSAEEFRRVFLPDGFSHTEDTVLAAARRQFAIEASRESDAVPDEYDGVIGVSFDSPNRRWSASSLTKIGSCPFKWFAERALRLGSPDEAETDLPANIKGSLYHKTLEIAVRKAMNSADVRTAVLDVLEEAFAEAELSGNISIEFVANWDLRRSEHLEKLRFAIRSEPFIGEGSRVVAIEKEFESEWHGLKIRGKLDRIDETPRGLMAVDYKTGSYTGRVKDEYGELNIDLQLPIYSQAALPSLYPGQAITNGIYLRLAKGKAEKERPVELERFAASVRSILSEGRFAVDPDVEQKACKFCDYDPVCRRGPRLARKTQLK